MSAAPCSSLQLAARRRGCNAVDRHGTVATSAVSHYLRKFGRDFSGGFRLLTFGDFSREFAGSYLGRIAVDDPHVGFSEWTLQVYLL